MVVAIALILSAVVSSGVVAFGMEAGWGRYGWGLELILLARRLEWPLILLSLMSSLALVGLVIANKRRVWWLAGLVPVVGMFCQFSRNPMHRLAILDGPKFVSAEEAGKALRGEEYVVGVLLGDTYYAYPYATLFEAPVVIQPDQARRMMLMWSAYANHATAVMIGRDIRPRELEIVSVPANALLVYNSRLGQFINGLTGQTVGGERPLGFEMELSTAKMPWGQWVAMHPQTLALAPTGRERREAGQPLRPMYAVPGKAEGSGNWRVAVLATTRPVAVVQEKVGPEPVNVMAGQTPVLLFRDPQTRQLKAFSREIGEQLMPRFRVSSDRAKPQVAFVDADTGTGWDRNGVAVDGDRKRRGQKLVPIQVEEDLVWGVMKYWRPGLELRDTSGR